MNVSVLPDFVAIGGLIAVFYSLLRRTRQSRLRFWLLGWAMLLVHIGAQFASQNLAGVAAAAAVVVSLAMLLLASVSFIWAGNDLRPAGSRNLPQALLSAVPDIAVIAVVVCGVGGAPLYLGLTVAGLLAALWLSQGGRRADDQRPLLLRVVVIVLAYALQGTLLYRGHVELALVWMLCWHYLAVAGFYWLSAPRTSVGVVFTTVSFVAWGLVFPVGWAIAVFLPHVHVEAEVWNLPKFLVATGMTFTLLEEQLSKAEHASLHDALTGLPNRRMFVSRLQRAMDTAATRGRRVALLVVDLDNFKQINDTLGHAVGDALLQGVAGRFGDHLREGDMLARLGGDEFAVLLVDVADRATAELIAAKLRHALEGDTVLEGHALHVDASIGLSLYPDDATHATRLYAVADRAMYACKDARPLRAPRMEPLAVD